MNKLKIWFIKSAIKDFYKGNNVLLSIIIMCLGNEFIINGYISYGFIIIFIGSIMNGIYFRLGRKLMLN